jgi:sulfate adenylyltransferase
MSKHTDEGLIAPHGGVLIDRMVKDEDRDAMSKRAQQAKQIHINDVTRSDLELIATGVVSPLTGFMNEDDYNSVVHNMRLSNGLPWSIPITLPVTLEVADTLAIGDDVALVYNGDIMGILMLDGKFSYDQAVEAENVYRTTEEAHPGVARIYEQGDVYLSGDVWVLNLPAPEFPDIYNTPAQTRAHFKAMGWKRIVAFQTRNPIHRAHEYLQKVALEIVDGLMLHPLVGATKSDDIPADVRVETYKVVLEHYFPQNRVFLNSFPASMRYAGPREAIFHAICRKNYGCSHFIVGRDHAGVGKYYGTYDAQNIFDEFDEAEIGITPLRFEHAFYSKREKQIVTAKTSIYGKEDWMFLSGTQVRELLQNGEMLPPEFTRPEVAEILLKAYAEKSDA